MNQADGGISPTVVIGAVVALGFLVVGAALYLPPGPASDQRLGIILAVLSPVILVLTNLIRTELAVRVSKETKGDTGELLNGGLQDKIDSSINRSLAQHVTVTHQGHKTGVDGP